MPMMVGQRAEGRDLRPRFFAMSGIMAVLLLALVGRLYVLQISRGEDYKEKSIDNFVKETRLPSNRGMVLDHRGRILVDSRPSYNVTLTPAFCQPSGAPKGYCLNEVLPRLSTYLSLDAEEVARVTEQFRKARGLKRFRDFNVKIDADLDALDRLEANKLELAGIDILAVPHRNYRFGPLAAHLLGYMNEVSAEEMESLNRDGLADYQLGDYVGRRGVERLFERDLRGTDGAEKTVVDAKGRRIRNTPDLLAGVERVDAPSTCRCSKRPRTRSRERPGASSWSTCTPASSSPWSTVRPTTRTSSRGASPGRSSRPSARIRSSRSSSVPRSSTTTRARRSRW
jgi:penicillin-binding protein 2